MLCLKILELRKQCGKIKAPFAAPSKLKFVWSLRHGSGGAGNLSLCLQSGGAQPVCYERQS
jgi:hypothetical protein